MSCQLDMKGNTPQISTENNQGVFNFFFLFIRTRKRNIKNNEPNLPAIAHSLHN